MRLEAMTLSLLTIALGVACSHSEEEPWLSQQDGGLPSLDAGVEIDARSADDAAPAPAKVCTDDAWCHTDVPAGQTLADVWGDGHGIVWAVSAEGAVLRWDGARWQARFQSEGALRAIWGASPTDLWIGGARGLFHGDGSAWTPVDLGEQGMTIDDITGVAGGDVWAVGKATTAGPPSPPPPKGPGPVPETSRPRAYRLSDRAAGWRRDPLDGVTSHAAYESLTEIARVFTTASGDVWIVVSKVESAGPVADGMDYLFRLQASDTLRWNVVPPPAELAGGTAAQFTGAGAVGDEGWLMGGVAFAGAAYWRAEVDAPVVSEDWQIGKWNTVAIYGHAIWGLSSSDLWVTGTSGQIRHWNGSTWTSARVSVDGDPIGADLVAVWGRTNDDIWTVGGNRALHKVSREEAVRLNDERARDR